MYGTIARFRLKPDVEAAQLMALGQEFEQQAVPGFVAEYVYHMDSDPHEYYMTVVFTDKEAYAANANSPEQNQRYQKWLALLDGAPEWHDGEIVYVGHGTQARSMA